MIRKGNIGFHGIMGELGLSHARREVDYLPRCVAAQVLKYINHVGVDIDALQPADHNQALDDPDLVGAESSSASRTDIWLVKVVRQLASHSADTCTVRVEWNPSIE